MRLLLQAGPAQSWCRLETSRIAVQGCSPLILDGTGERVMLKGNGMWMYRYVGHRTGTCQEVAGGQPCRPLCELGDLIHAN